MGQLTYPLGVPGAEYRCDRFRDAETGSIYDILRSPGETMHTVVRIDQPERFAMKATTIARLLKDGKLVSWAS
jgi:hypothetical protein